MMTKTKLALSALLVVSFASAALADVPENKIGDRYPFLEQTIQQPVGANAYASVRHPVKRYTAAEKALFDRIPVIW
jgi:hypothetical protein